MTRTAAVIRVGRDSLVLTGLRRTVRVLRVQWDATTQTLSRRMSVHLALGVHPPSMLAVLHCRPAMLQPRAPQEHTRFRLRPRVMPVRSAHFRTPGPPPAPRAPMGEQPPMKGTMNVYFVPVEPTERRGRVMNAPLVNMPIMPPAVCYAYRPSSMT